MRLFEKLKSVKTAYKVTEMTRRPLGGQIWGRVSAASSGHDLRTSVERLNRHGNKKKEILTEMLNHSRQESIWPTWIFQRWYKATKVTEGWSIFSWRKASIDRLNTEQASVDWDKHEDADTDLKSRVSVLVWPDCSSEVRCHPQWLTSGSIMNGKAWCFILEIRPITRCMYKSRVKMEKGQCECTFNVQNTKRALHVQ